MRVKHPKLCKTYAVILLPLPTLPTPPGPPTPLILHKKKKKFLYLAAFLLVKYDRTQAQCPYCSYCLIFQSSRIYHCQNSSSCKEFQSHNFVIKFVLNKKQNIYMTRTITKNNFNISINKSNFNIIRTNSCNPLTPGVYKKVILKHT